MTVIPLPSESRRIEAQPIFAFADLQREYVSVGRAYAIENTHSCLDACLRLLLKARQLRLTIVHFRQLRRETFFNPHCPFSDWIDDYRPRPSEAIYDRASPSIYANENFAKYIDGIDQPTIFLAGFSGDQACLASAIDAHRRRHRMVVLDDCSASAALSGWSERESHAMVTAIIERYVEIASLQRVFDSLSQLQDEPRRGLR